MDRHLSPSETARRFGVSIKALRLYEQRGLLARIGAILTGLDALEPVLALQEQAIGPESQRLSARWARFGQHGADQ